MDFLEPLKPLDPADDQAITFPLSSVIETIVLLDNINWRVYGRQQLMPLISLMMLMMQLRNLVQHLDLIG